MERTLNSMSVQRQVWPLQCTAEPPTTSPGRNEPRRRIGSASCDGLLRMVSVSRAVFCMRSWRMTKRSSSRTIGTAKSFSGERAAPRSSATTWRPASASSLPRMPPVQPSPTMATSTSFSFVTIVAPSTHVRDADRLGREFLVAIFGDVFAMHRDHAGEADHAPAGFVAVAAVNRVGEHAFHHCLVDGAPERARRQAVVEGELAGGEGDEHLLALLVVEAVERLAIRLAAVRVGRRDALAVELRGGKRQLVALLGRAALPRPLHVEA